MMTFIAGFAVGFGPLPWVMNVELMPPEARVSGTIYLFPEGLALNPE